LKGSDELLFGASHEPAEVCAALSSRYRVIDEPAAVEQWTWLDTADWRLYRAGMTLRERRGGRIGELVLSADAGDCVSKPSRAGRWPRLVAALPASPVRDRVEPSVGVRALLPLAAVEAHSTRLQLLDDEDKTRVRVQIDQQRLAGPGGTPLPLRVALTALRGYERDARRCAELLKTTLTGAGAHSDASSAAFAAAGRTPGQSGRPLPVIGAQDPAATSITQILRSFGSAIEANRAGVLDDIDIEFLHELRTAVRATRSILSLTGDVLPAGSTDGFAAEFGWLGRLSTPVRDLDVMLLQLHGGGTVDLRGLAGLDPVRDLLLTQRRRAFRALRVGLASERGATLPDQWRRALDRIATSHHAGPSTGEIAVARARRAYQRIRKASAGVTAATPADHLHTLRRRCKQMRYLLDGFGPVYDPRSHRIALVALKKLQDDLGDIQDSDVQRSRLAEAAASLSSRGVPLATILDIGALQDRIAERDRAARAELNSRLSRIRGADVASHIASLEASSR
jgi:CHAD domain-containing protein